MAFASSNKWPGWLLSLLLLSVSIHIQAGCDFDDFPVHDSMDVFEIAGNTVFNGRVMGINGFHADVGPGDIIEFYHERWRDEFADSEWGPWYQVAHINDECMMMVQVAASEDGRSVGRLSILNPPRGNVGGKPQLPADIPALPGTVTVMDMANQDDFKLGRSWLITNSGTVADNYQFYLAEYRRKGWAEQMSQTRSDAAVLVFRRDLDEVNIIIQQGQSQTKVWITRVEI